MAEDDYMVIALYFRVAFAEFVDVFREIAGQIVESCRIYYEYSLWLISLQPIEAFTAAEGDCCK
jgi:hypothetical protein